MGTPDAWPYPIALFAGLGFAELALWLSYRIPRALWRDAELVIDAEKIQVSGPNAVELNWHDIAEVTVRPTLTAGGGRTLMFSVQARPRATLDGIPRRRCQLDGWIVLFGTGTSPAVRAETAAALTRFGGSRWRSPPVVVTEVNRP